MMETTSLLVPASAGTLLCLNLSNEALAAIAASEYKAATKSLPHSRTPPMGSELMSADLVLLDVTDGGEDKIETVRRIQSAICMSGAPCRILCFSAAQRNPDFVLDLTKFGVRYVRISQFAMLLEAIELQLIEIAKIERAGPCFRVQHRFSRGSCAPGEEIAAIKLIQNGDFYQLPLALSARFTFNCLAENRSIALDAFQIASTLNGWFYRAHGLNSGIRQTTKVRVATVKVLVQRIRQAMASTFAKAGLTCDPCDVLRSFNAEGSRRALYRLRADIRWEHRLQ